MSVYLNLSVEITPCDMHRYAKETINNPKHSQHKQVDVYLLHASAHAGYPQV